MSKFKAVLAAAALLTLTAGSAWADTFNGGLFFTRYGGPGWGVWNVHYEYDDSTNTFALSNQTLIHAGDGADGIIFDANGRLLVGGQGLNVVHMYSPTTGALIDNGSTTAASYHLALDPSGTKVYTSDFGGELQVLALSGATIADAVQYNTGGDDGGLTGEAWDPVSQQWFYVNGQPNGGGNVGYLDIDGVGHTSTTDRIFSGVASAHGLNYDSFTGLMTLFGAGWVGLFDGHAGTEADIFATLKQHQTATCDFDQGAVDGKGHALIAGCGAVTFLDYSQSHDITNPDYYAKVTSAFSPQFNADIPFDFIDDVAPLSGAGSNTTPEPTTLALLGSGLVGALIRRRRQARRS